MPIIRIYEIIEEKTKEKIMPVLEKIDPGSTITLKLICKGGRRSNHEPIIEKIKDLRDNYDCHLIAEGTIFWSAAFSLFLLCHERIITPQSSGMLHLSEFSNKKLRHDYEMRQKEYRFQDEDAEFISRHTALSIEQVRLYNQSELNAAKLIKFKIANKIVSHFTY